MNINYYTNNSGKNLILDYINSLSKEEQIDALSAVSYTHLTLPTIA